jgi:hypothetical protein
MAGTYNKTVRVVMTPSALMPVRAHPVHLVPRPSSYMKKIC